MPDLRHTRKNIKIAIAVMAGIDLLAAAVYFSPLVGSAETRRQEMNRLQAELTVKTRRVEPVKNLPQKDVLANPPVVDFYKRNFSPPGSEIPRQVGKFAGANSG